MRIGDAAVQLGYQNPKTVVLLVRHEAQYTIRRIELLESGQMRTAKRPHQWLTLRHKELAGVRCSKDPLVSLFVEEDVCLGRSPIPTHSTNRLNHIGHRVRSRHDDNHVEIRNVHCR